MLVVQLEHKGHKILIVQEGEKFFSEIDGKRVIKSSDTIEEAVHDAKNRCEIFALQDQVLKQEKFLTEQDEKIKNKAVSTIEKPKEKGLWGRLFGT